MAEVNSGRVIAVVVSDPRVVSYMKKQYPLAFEEGRNYAKMPSNKGDLHIFGSVDYGIFSALLPSELRHLPHDVYDPDTGDILEGDGDLLGLVNSFSV